MTRNLPFILFLALTLCGEGMLTVTLVWTVLDKGGSAAHVGIILALMSLVPFLVQKWSRRVRAWMTHQPLMMFGTARLIGLLALGIVFLQGAEVGITGLYLLAGIFSIILFLSTQSLEVYMSHLVLEERLSSAQASSFLQTSIQIGAFGGNAIAGFLLETGGFQWVLIGLGTSLGIGMLFPFLVRFIGEFSGSGPANAKRTATLADRPVQMRKQVLSLTIMAVILLTIQLAAFNFLLPIFFHDVREWSPMQYGFVSSAAGLGALLATLVGKWERFIPKRSFLWIAVLDLLLIAIHHWTAAIVIGFFIGFVFNRNRIVQRSMMFDHLTNKTETTLWTGRSTLAFQFMKAAVPLMLLIPLEWAGNQSSGIVFAVVGIGVSLWMLVVYQREVKLIQTQHDSVVKVG